MDFSKPSRSSTTKESVRTILVEEDRTTGCSEEEREPTWRPRSGAGLDGKRREPSHQHPQTARKSVPGLASNCTWSSAGTASEEWARRTRPPTGVRHG